MRAAAPEAAHMPPTREYPNYLALQIPRDEHSLDRTKSGTLQTDLIAGGEVNYTIVLPPNHTKEREEPYPLVIDFHPAAQAEEHLTCPHEALRVGRDIVAPRDVVWAAFASGAHAEGGTASAADSCGIYLNPADGNESWDSFLMTEFIPFVESTYCCGGEQARRYARGNCMGATASLKIAFRYPMQFAAIIAQQPAFSPLCAELEDEKRLPEGFQSYYPQFLPDGSSTWCNVSSDTVGTFDDATWRSRYSLVAMAQDNAKDIRDSGIQIYLDVGDQDGLCGPAESLHRALWHHRIRHEYHLVCHGSA